ncbi:unnamed protein product [Mytilus edulis]|uniref:Transglutaminase-like domain-containing protein n=1 Tax=Mytilus edulis TaxID=6550 RepID=A0A8S3TNT6_MYTED|nr:unnamed protein product [Mytilus edulis]
MSTITIGSVNCRGLSETVKRIDIFTKYKDLYDITILVDTHSTSEKEKQWLHEWGYVGKFSSYSSKSRGVAILFKNTFEFKIHDETIDLMGNFIILDITIQDYRITLAAIYGPNNDDPVFFENIKHKISRYSNSSIVVAGDWNVVQDYDMDTLHYRSENNPQSKAKIHEVMHELDLLDIWRQQHPFDNRYSWRGPNHKQSRLDYFMITSDIEAFVVSSDIGISYRSDHSPVLINLKFSSQIRGKGTWKFNNSLLRETEFIEKVKGDIKTVIEEYEYKNVTYDLKITYNDLKPIDDHALQTPKSVENSINELADYLAKPAKSELETIRSFYVWICNNISYNTTAYFSGTSAVTEASGVLKSKSSVCEGYANLVQALYHAWNVVFVSGKWRFIETTWGSGHIDENGAFVKNFSNFFFLTKPEHFIEDYYPYINNDIEGSKDLQLLKQTFSLEDVSKSLKTTKYARDWGVIFPSHRYEVVKVDKKASISMESKQNTLSKVSVNLYSSSRKLCNESVVMIKDNFSKYTVIVRPKEIGKYTLKVFGTIDQSQNVMPQLTEYLIESTSTEDEFVPYPEHNGFYGPSTDFKLRGFASSESISAFQICQNGEFELTMKTNKTFKCSADIFETDGSRSSDFVMVEQSNSSVCVKARFVSKGYYKITLFSEFEGSDTYSEAMNILVLNKKAAKIPTPFPQTYSTTAEYNCHLIEPIARNIPSNSNVLFVMSSPVIQELLIDGKVYKRKRSIMEHYFKNG